MKIKQNNKIGYKWDGGKACKEHWGESNCKIQELIRKESGGKWHMFEGVVEKCLQVEENGIKLKHTQEER